jgi:RNA polymerase sigma-70 factor (ECF subfamily)
MSQESLLRRIHENDPQALEEFVHDELPRVFNLCLRLCQNKSEAEDLCQDVFTRAVAGIKNFRGDAALSTWLYRITMNAWKNWVRYEKTRHKSKHFSLWSKKEDDGETLTEIPIAEKYHTPDVWAEISDEHKRLLEALDHLEPEEKSIIVLRDMEDKSYEDIAEMLKYEFRIKSRRNFIL